MHDMCEMVYTCWTLEPCCKIHILSINTTTTTTTTSNNNNNNYTYRTSPEAAW